MKYTLECSIIVGQTWLSSSSKKEVVIDETFIDGTLLLTNGREWDVPTFLNEHTLLHGVPFILLPPGFISK